MTELNTTPFANHEINNIMLVVVQYFPTIYSKPSTKIANLKLLRRMKCKALFRF